MKLAWFLFLLIYPWETLTGIQSQIQSLFERFDTRIIFYCLIGWIFQEVAYGSHPFIDTLIEMIKSFIIIAKAHPYTGKISIQYSTWFFALPLFYFRNRFQGFFPPAQFRIGIAGTHPSLERVIGKALKFFKV